MHTKERLSHIGNAYRVYSNSNDALACLPALHHANCVCRVDQIEWEAGWDIRVNGISDISEHAPYNCDYCPYVCGSAMRYTSIQNAAPEAVINPDASFYGFITIMLDSQVNEYQMSELRDPRKIIWFLGLLGEYSDEPGNTLAFPWLADKSEKYRSCIEKLRVCLSDYIIQSRGSVLEKALEVLGNPKSRRWKELQRMYEQLLFWKLRWEGRRFQSREEVRIYQSALTEFKALTGREPVEQV
jgi:hypothetical protein